MKYKIHTYGCQMNVHESEKIAGILQDLGYTTTEDENQADIIVFNTCCIRDTAEKKIVGNIGLIKTIKKNKKNLKVIVCGCMTQQDNAAEELHKKFPFIDIIIGTHNLDSLKDYIILSQKNKKVIEIQRDNIKIVEDTPLLRTSYPNAWVNIMYGCNNFCTYCIVPYVRGRERSRNAEKIITDVKKLVDEGYKEITLLGQNVNSYGKDFEDKNINFANLLEQIDKIEGKFRVRFMTSHPKDFNNSIIDIIASSNKICNNIHLPIQSGSNAILKAMNRHYTREEYLKIIDNIRAKIPDCGITTDIMVGFPGETEEDFRDTLQVVSKVKYSNAFTFIYSSRKGTPAAKMEQIPQIVKKERIAELIKLQNSITRKQSHEYYDKTLEVLCEDVNSKYKDTVCGRNDYGRLVNFKGDRSMVGNFYNVKIINATTASLFGEKIDG